MSDAVRQVCVGTAWIAGLLAVVPLGTMCVYAAALSPEDPGLRVWALVTGGLAGLALGFGPLVTALLYGRRWNLWVTLALVLVGVALAGWMLALQPAPSPT